MKIYVELRGEGTQVWRPVEALHVQGDLYRITQTNARPDDEDWAFGTGCIVRCKQKRTQEGELILVAHEETMDSQQS